MLVFIIPLRSVRSAKSWETVSKLLERTLRSICNQTSSDFRVVVVCHERPVLQGHYPQVEYIEVDFQAPTQASSINERRIDKNRKLWIGIHHAAKFKGAYLMPMDSDDCISKNLVAFVTQHSETNGWYFSQGYQYQEGSALIRYRKKYFEQYCGSCNIIQAEILLDHIKEIQFADITPEFLLHTQLPYVLEKSLNALPFPGAVYITDNSENTLNQIGIISHQFAGKNPLKLVQFYALRLIKPLISQRLAPTIRDEFGLYTIEKSKSN
ncbi:glycosyltransferase family A protein [Leptolyngbya sp. AN03gr2]|uniref:glycosyltransferase family A protein n=1 Tax=unclassified Leptolyngbya TaxID=2650499 RepID=UPI003D31BC03